ncbi:hypothetical protein J6590_054837 [Homalodisca vitripennis]|nr:hypothetical protein J6590_054837 [Homalodisca vitripennis]
MQQRPGLFVTLFVTLPVASASHHINSALTNFTKSLSLCPVDLCNSRCGTRSFFSGRFTIFTYARPGTNVPTVLKAGAMFKKLVRAWCESRWRAGRFTGQHHEWPLDSGDDVISPLLGSRCRWVRTTTGDLPLR